MALARIKSFIDTGLKTVSTPLDRTVNLEPEVGIRIVHSVDEKALHVTVLGARHLPQNFGFTRVNSYVVKVRTSVTFRYQPALRNTAERSGARSRCFKPLLAGESFLDNARRVWEPRASRLAVRLGSPSRG